MNNKKQKYSEIMIDKEVLLSGDQKSLKTEKIIQKLQEEEYLILTDENGVFTGEIGKRNLSHKEGLPHYSVHIWVVDIQRFQDDIGIYICKKAKRKGGGYYQFRTAGGHVGVSSDWKMKGDKEDLRKEILEDTARREVMEELGLVLKKNGEIIDIKTGDILKYNSNFRNLIDKISYNSIKEEFKNGKQVIEKNNEYIGVYAFEFSGSISNFEKKEIESIKILSSKKLIEKLEGDGSFFGHKNPKTWKQTNKYKVAIRVIKQLQQVYGI